MGASCMGASCMGPLCMDKVNSVACVPFYLTGRPLPSRLLYLLTCLSHLQNTERDGSSDGGEGGGGG